MKFPLFQFVFACSVFLALEAVALTRYVDLNNPSPSSPYTNWVTAATNIQNAVDAAVPGDLVLVTNGVYQTGGRVVPPSRLTNRVAVTKSITVQSVNGPSVTIIKGYQVPGTFLGTNAIRGVYLTNYAALIGFTVTNGATWNGYDSIEQTTAGGIYCYSTNAVVTNCFIFGNNGYWCGGVYRATLNNCIIAGNVAFANGGAYVSALTSCVLTNNKAGAGFSTLTRCDIMGNYSIYGGTAFCDLNYCRLVANQSGSHRGTLNNCLLTGNADWASSGSTLNNCVVVGNTNGLADCFAYNCIVYHNAGPNHFSSGELGPNGLYYCCTTPMPNTIGNITNAPLFVDEANGDLRLQSNSPCINAGNNAYAPPGLDFDDNPRVIGSTVDMGAYEFQWPSSTLSYAWAQQNGLATDGSADLADPDGDGANNWQEWRADTIPTNASSVLKMITITNNPSGLNVTWQSVPTRKYWLERSTNLNEGSPFNLVANGITGAAGIRIYTDASATNRGPYFYRVGVQQ